MTLTDPVNVVSPGLYTFVGPLPASVPNGASPHGFSFPPDAAGIRFAMPPVQMPALVQRGGRTFVTFTMRVTAVASPYYGLRAWVQ
jgi:hypothetical protein